MNSHNQYQPSVASHTIQSERMLPKEVGSTWVTNYDGKQWPVVLCDDETPPASFMGSRPAGNVYPAILLGKCIYIWVADHRLREFEPHKRYTQDQPLQTEDIIELDSNGDKLEETRRQAFGVDAWKFETPAYWKNVIEERSRARALERERARLTKRPQSDDENIEIVSVHRSTSSASSSKRRRIEKNSNRSKNGYPPTPVSNAKKRKTQNRRRKEDDESSDDLFVREAKSQSDPFTSINSDETERENNRRSIQMNPPGDDICVIFVGSSHVPFLVPKDKGGVSECDFLGNLVIFTEEHRSHINLDEHVHIQPRAFLPIAEYLQKGEFAPRLIDSGSFTRLEGIVLSEEKDKAAMDISKIYLTASKIQFAALQLLCVDKLKALYPLDSNSLLVVLTVVMTATAYGCEAEDEIKEWLVDYIVDHFWTMVEYEGPSMARLMCEYGEIWRCVSEKLSQSPGLGSRVD